MADEENVKQDETVESPAIEKQVFSNEAGDVILEISEDAMTASLTIRDTGQFINEADILELIKQSGIREGFEKAGKVRQFRQIEKDFDKPFPIAVGTQPTEAQMEFSPLFEEGTCFDPGNFGNNFKMLQDFRPVKMDEPLAHLFITKESQDGLNVLGEPVPPQKSARELLDGCLGENVRYSEERSQVFAAQNGYPYLDPEGRVGVTADFTVNEDIGLDYEDFSLHGNLTVNGNIADKIQIEVVGNLVVNGDVNDASIRVQGNVRVNGDILNCQKEGVMATGNVEFRSAENSRIIAQKKIIFHENSQFCTLIGESGIFGDESKSAIIGGHAQSGTHIEAAVIGSSSAIGTDVEVAISPWVKERMLHLTRQLMSLREDEEANAEKITVVTDELQEMESKLEEEINRTLLGDDSSPKHITAYRKIFPGVYLRILKKSTNIVEEDSRVSFSVVDGAMNTDHFA